MTATRSTAAGAGQRVAPIIGWTALALGVAVWLAVLLWAARGDRTRARFEPPAAPGLELSAGTHRVEAAAAGAALADVEVRVFDLATRTPLELTGVEGGLTFEVPEAGIYVIDVERRDPSVAAVDPLDVRVVQPSTFRFSLRLLAAVALAPLASMPGALALWFARGGGGAGGASPEGVALPRRLAAIAIDGVAALLIVTFLILISPPFRPIAGLIPLAPVAYAWSTAARGQGVGGWLLLVRTTGRDGRPPGVWRGLLRTLAAAGGWALGGFGYTAAALDVDGRAWHDRVSATRVAVA